MRKIALASALFLVPGLVLAGQVSAYEALRVVGKEKGEALLGKLVELRGVDGSPQPGQWTICFADPAARGGVREFVVSSKGIIGERAPLRSGGSPGGAMAASRLKMDSSGVFAAANKQASKAKVGFESVNYRLHNRGGTPVWTVQLYDVGGDEVGSVDFSAKDGSVVTPWRVPLSAPKPVPGSAAAGSSPLGERWAEGGGLVGHAGRFGERTWQSTSNGAVRTWQSTTNGTSRAWHATSDFAGRVGQSVRTFFVGRPDGEAASR